MFCIEHILPACRKLTEGKTSIPERSLRIKKSVLHQGQTLPKSGAVRAHAMRMIEGICHGASCTRTPDTGKKEPQERSDVDCGSY